MIFILLDLGHGRNHLKKPNLHHPKDVLAPDPLYDEDQGKAPGRLFFAWKRRLQPSINFDKAILF
jgi:hypothetical protein